MATTQDREKLRKQRQKQRRRKKARKNFLVTLTVIILVLSAFIVTIKICNPDFDFSSLIPKKQVTQVISFVNEDILGKTTTTEPVSTTQPKPTTTSRPINDVDYDYDEFSEFDFNTAYQGNQIGNLLNNSRGTVTYSSKYIYYSIQNKGIYKFEPTNESNSKLIVDNYSFVCLNVLNDYLFAIDSNTGTLYRIAVSNGDKLSVAENMEFVYLYNDKLYFIRNDNSIGFIDTSSLAPTILYTANADKKIYFAGISLSRVFFVLYDGVGETYNEYITISTSDSSDKKYFMADTSNGDIINLQIECGFMYYYKKQDDGGYSLCRQKFGSDKVVTLVENCTLTDYPIVCANRLYYSELGDNKIVAKELNMNSNDTMTMLAVNDADENGNIAVGFGYQYIFLTGCKSGFDGKPNDDFVLKGSCIYTSSSDDNTLTFKEDKLVY